MRLRRTPLTALCTGVLLLSTAPAALAAGEETPPPSRTIDRFCANVPQDDQPFTDVAGDTFEASIECLAATGITSGGPGTLPDDQYGPALPVRRDSMATFLARMIDEADRLDTGDEIRPLAPFDGTVDATDVGSGNVHRQSIDRLVAAGIVRNGPEGRRGDQYGPELPVNRAQMASFLVQALAYTTGESFETPNDYFTDDEMAAPHQGNINAVAASAIAIGDGQDLYDPFRTVSRGQMAEFLTRTLASLEDAGLVRPADAPE
jgi:hypothetical protein